MRQSTRFPAPTRGDAYDPACRRCARLAGFLDQVRERHPDYHAGPVAAFGDPSARVLVVGLAPGMHGANRTGRPFTGDYAGILLYATLHRYGFASQPEGASPDDGLILRDCRITNAVKCLPPDNKPNGAEISECNSFLAAELRASTELRAILVLGRVAHQAVLRALRLRPASVPFAHGAVQRLPSGPTLFSSYHCSRYNTQTNRLTADMFAAVIARLRKHLDGAA